MRKNERNRINYDNQKMLERLINGKPTVQLVKWEKQYQERRTQLNSHGRYPYILDRDMRDLKDEPVQKGFDCTYTAKASASKTNFFSLGWMAQN